MSRIPDIENDGEYKKLDQNDGLEESEALLVSGSNNHVQDSYESGRPGRFARIMDARFTSLQLLLSFFIGFMICFTLQYAFSWCTVSYDDSTNNDAVRIAAPSHVGSTEHHNFPPVSPTNAHTSLFPTQIGYAGPTPTGAEPGVVATAPSYPIHTGAPSLVTPSAKGGAKNSQKDKFDMFKYWGNLSPWYSIERGAFGIDSSPDAPPGCAVTGLHFLHRHGARYPTNWGTFIHLSYMAWIMSR